MAVTAGNVTSRRRIARRKKERRTNPFAFNSAEWIAVMQEQYLLWPKQDRRIYDRRASERREIDRRTALRNRSAMNVPFKRTRLISADDILNEEEKQMIQALYADEEKPSDSDLH